LIAECSLICRQLFLPPLALCWLCIVPLPWFGF
jgi:hypothetical protein